ncbi:MAG TPA: AMP-binding protein, partial [Chloroflexota bacterium]
MTVHNEVAHPARGADSQPWLQWYEPGISATIEVPSDSLPHVLARNAARYPTRTAIRYFGRTITYHRLEEEVNRFTSVLRQLGVRKGDRVALMLPNCPQMAIAIYGTWQAGAVVVPTSPLYSPSE